MIGVVDSNQKVSCPNCEWKGLLGDAFCALYIDPKFRTPVAMGGDGYNFRCPVCKMKVHEVRYNKPLKLIR